jgi:hypothetical protein
LRANSNFYLLINSAFCRPGQDTIPWDRIAASPADYYDTSTFPFGIPTPLFLDTFAAHKLAKVLMEVSSPTSTTPFRFRTTDGTSGLPIHSAPIGSSGDPSSSTLSASVVSSISSSSTQDASASISTPSFGPPSPPTDAPHFSSPPLPHSPARGTRVSPPRSPSVGPPQLSTNYSKSSSQSPIPLDSSRNDLPDRSRSEAPHEAPTFSAHDSSAPVDTTNTNPSSTDTTYSSASYPPPALQNATEGLLSRMTPSSPERGRSPLRLLADATSTASKVLDLSVDPVHAGLSAPDAGASTGYQTEHADSGQAGVTDGRSVHDRAEESGVDDVAGDCTAGKVLIEGNTEANHIVGGERASGGGNDEDVITARRSVGGTLRGGRGGRGRARAKGRAKGVGRQEVEQYGDAAVGVEVVATRVGGRGRVVEEKAAKSAKQVEDGREARRPSRARASARGLSPAAAAEPNDAPQDSLIMDFLQDSRKRSLSFTLRGSGRPGKIRKVA